MEKRQDITYAPQYKNKEFPTKKFFLLYHKNTKYKGKVVFIKIVDFYSSLMKTFHVTIQNDEL